MNWVFDNIEEFAAALLRRAGITRLPVPVEEIAFRLGAERIERGRLREEDGRLELHNSEITIVVNSDASAARRRFTIAHEIGHLVLADPRYDVSALRPAGPQWEERLCDRIAEALLMPSAWVTDHYEGAPQRLSTLFDFCRRFGVSAAAANLRLQRCTSWRRSLLRFADHGEGWRLAAVTGWSPEPRASVRMIAETELVLERFAEPDTLSRLWLPLGSGGRSWLFGAELWGRQGWALALADSRRRRSWNPAERTLVLQPASNLNRLKLFYTLDDIDACILPTSTSREGNHEQDDREEEGRRALAI